MGERVREAENEITEYKRKRMQTSCLLVFSLGVIIIYYLFIEDALYMGLELNSLHLCGVYIPADNLVSRCSSLRSVTLASLDVNLIGADVPSAC